MQAIDVVNKLKEIVGLYTDDFSDVSSLTSLTRSGSTITAVKTAHGLTTGDYLTIRGAKEPIALTSISRVDNIGTVVSAIDHKLSDPSLYSPAQRPLYVELAGNDPSDYNGVFELLTVPDDTSFTFKITTTPTTPATTAGYLLLEDQDGYNGYKQITVIDVNSFSYPTTNTNLGSPAQGTLQISNSTRIAYSATPDRILDFYSENAEGILKNWLFVVMGDQIVYKDGTVASDLSTAQEKNQSYWYTVQQNLEIYIVIPSKGSILGGAESDLARSYETALLRSIVNYAFPSPLTEEDYQPITYVGNETDDYIKAYYVHRFDFLAKGFVQTPDTISFNKGVPLQLINGTITDKQMTFKPNMRS
jgi:hypothetical protein